MGLLGPVANAVAAKAGISPAIATTVAGIAMHYLVSSHPAAGAAGASAPLNLGAVTSKWLPAAPSPPQRCKQRHGQQRNAGYWLEQG